MKTCTLTKPHMPLAEQMSDKEPEYNTRLLRQKAWPQLVLRRKHWKWQI